MCQPRPLFLFLFIIFQQKLSKITVGFNRILTRIVRIEGEYADHLTTTITDSILTLFIFCLTCDNSMKLSSFSYGPFFVKKVHREVVGRSVYNRRCIGTDKLRQRQYQLTAMPRPWPGGFQSFVHHLRGLK